MFFSKLNRIIKLEYFENKKLLGFESLMSFFLAEIFSKKDCLSFLQIGFLYARIYCVCICYAYALYLKVSLDFSNNILCISATFDPG